MNSNNDACEMSSLVVHGISNSNDDCGGASPSSSYGSSQQDHHKQGQADIVETSMKPKATYFQPDGPHDASIGWWGSYAIAVNSLTGPAMLSLPATFQRSGLIPTMLTLIFVCILSSLCSLNMAAVISKVPGNHNFKKEIEFSEAFQTFWGQTWFVATQVVFFCCVSCLNISSIVDTSQVVDTFLGHHGASYALQFLPGSVEWIRWTSNECSQKELLEGECLPFFKTNGLILTAGYVLSAAFFLPLCLLDLKENSNWQIFGFIVLLVTSIQFVISFLIEGIEFDRISLWGETWDTLFGVVLFNFALVIAVPAWLYEKRPDINVPTVVHGSSIMSALMYVMIGCIGALALPNVSDNMLESMMSGAFGPVMAIGATIFAFFIIGLGIPLFSVLCRMSLTGTGMCSHRVANTFAVYLPWALSWIVYQGVTGLLAWGGVIFTSLIAFILPILLGLHTVKKYGDVQGSISVYGGLIQTKQQEETVLYILLGLAIASVILAIVGLILG